MRALEKVEKVKERKIVERLIFVPLDDIQTFANQYCNQIALEQSRHWPQQSREQAEVRYCQCGSSFVSMWHVKAQSLHF